MAEKRVLRFDGYQKSVLNVLHDKILKDKVIKYAKAVFHTDLTNTIFEYDKKTGEVTYYAD